jgi:putative transposase
MTYPLVRDPAAENNPVRLTCGVLGHSTHAYYAWAAAPISQHDLDDAYSTNALIEARGDDPSSATASSPTKSPAPASSPANGGSGDCVLSRGCGRRQSAKAGGAPARSPAALHDDHVQRNFSACRLTG